MFEDFEFHYHGIFQMYCHDIYEFSYHEFLG
jgi:hypothetical protein